MGGSAESRRAAQLPKRPSSLQQFHIKGAICEPLHRGPIRQFADSTHVSGAAAPRPFNHGAITRTCCARNGRPQWCTERPLLARRLLAKPLPHIPEVSRRVTAAEFGADAKLDVAAL